MSARQGLGSSLGAALAISGAAHAMALVAIIAAGPPGTRPPELPAPQVVEVRFAPAPEVAHALETSPEFAPAPDMTSAQETMAGEAAPAQAAPPEITASATENLPEPQAIPPPRPKARPVAAIMMPSVESAHRQTEPVAERVKQAPPATALPPAPTASAFLHPAPAGAPARAGAARPAGPQAGNPVPAYPRRARERGIEGRVTLKVEVLADGSAGSVQVIGSSGHALLDRAALDAVRTWRFRPAERDGVPLVSSIEIPVSFRLVD
ncbi:MAG: TonB family protein [Alphaproteobacteria bacterium]|nr:TonB family protein [Alphaproteobacteria bacterium]